MICPAFALKFQLGLKIKNRRGAAAFSAAAAYFPGPMSSRAWPPFWARRLWAAEKQIGKRPWSWTCFREKKGSTVELRFQIFKKRTIFR
jgi:hypothetical protein